MTGYAPFPEFASRTGFAPETTWTRHNERDRNWTKP